MIPQHLDYRGRESFLSKFADLNQPHFWMAANLWCSQCRTWDWWQSSFTRSIALNQRFQHPNPQAHGSCKDSKWVFTNSPVTRIKMDRVSIYANMIFEWSLVVSNTYLNVCLDFLIKHTWLEVSQNQGRCSHHKLGSCVWPYWYWMYLFNARWERGSYSTIGRKQPTYAFKCQDWDGLSWSPIVSWWKSLL